MHMSLGEASSLQLEDLQKNVHVRKITLKINAKVRTCALIDDAMNFCCKVSQRNLHFRQNQINVHTSLLAVYYLLNPFTVKSTIMAN
jgi:Fe-S cluster assembly iron-binding protein IscA